jgi:hypothetical protein
MAQITEDTTYGEIKMGDTFEDGGEVVGILRPAQRAAGPAVSATRSP